MRDGRPSFTASVVSLARGLAGDPCAERLLPGPLSAVLRVLRGASVLPLGAATVSIVTGGVPDHIALRTAEIDDAVRSATRDGIEQVVILGAGLDARAYRMQELRDAVVLEVDHAATQEFKRSRVVRLRPEAKEVRFVAVDFERDTLSAALEQAGHRTDARTLFIWEGVTPYLEPSAIRATLTRLATRSASGSRLVMTYVTPEMTTFPVAPRLVHAAFGIIGERLRGAMSPELAAAEMESAGFRVVSDTSPAAWARARRHPRPWALVVSERLAIAVRD